MWKSQLSFEHISGWPKHGKLTTTALVSALKTAATAEG